MNKITLKSVYFKKLKGLNNVNIRFSDTLTAIMGVNGSGKTTVIHALSCLYQPDGNGENHRFPDFFVPNTDALWNGSELNVVNEIVSAEGTHTILPSREYCKKIDRWSPRYENRPKRNVYYIGIETCLLDIEKRTTSSRIMYKSEVLHDKLSKKTIEYCSYILNKDYSFFIDNSYNKKHFPGVEMKSGLKYSSLSMGSGEQRIIKIINVLLNAEAYSLILIDEIDLLLHISALRRLIKTIHKIASDRHIQVVFTTHSLEVTKFSEMVSIQYVQNTSEREPSLIFERITPELIYNMTEQAEKKLCIYVEDELAKAIINQLVRKNNMSLMVGVICFGAVENAFTLAASFAINNDTVGKLIVLDGDRYTSEQEKNVQINKKLSGTECDANERRNSAIGLITEFALPPRISPEEFLHEVILRCFDSTSEIYTAANEIKSVSDSHEWIGSICSKLDMTLADIIRDVFKYAINDDLFKQYICSINDWLLANKN